MLDLQRLRHEAPIIFDSAGDDIVLVKSTSDYLHQITAEERGIKTDMLFDRKVTIYALHNADGLAYIYSRSPLLRKRLEKVRGKALSTYYNIWLRANKRSQYGSKSDFEKHLKDVFYVDTNYLIVFEKNYV